MPESVIVNGVRYVTTAEAAEHFAPDVTTDMIRDWVKRGILKPAGHFPGRSAVFRLEDVAHAERRTRLERRGRTRQAGKLRLSRSSGDNLPATPLAEAAQKPVYRPRCSVTRDNGRDCRHLAVPDAPFRICQLHLEQAHTHRREQMVAAYEANPDAPFDPALERTAALPEEPTFVYYLRFGDRIKIGYTGNIRQRLTAIPHDELLALEPGPMDLERMRHKQFHAHRVSRNGEWFYAVDELLSHTRMLVDHYGPPGQQIEQIAANRPVTMARGADGMLRFITTRQGVPDDSLTHIRLPA